MLSWKEYQKLNIEQKEEYYFRYKDKPIFGNFSGVLSNSIIVLNAMTIFLFGYYIAVKNPEHFSEEVVGHLMGTFSIFPALSKVVLLILAAFFIEKTWHLIKYILCKRWYKRCINGKA